jgi:hypothetical protein
LQQLLQKSNNKKHFRKKSFNELKKRKKTLSDILSLTAALLPMAGEGRKTF